MMQTKSTKTRSHPPKSVCPDGAALFWPQSRWSSMQYRLLIRHLTYSAKAPLYTGRIKPRHIGKLSDLSSLPTTTKDQLIAAGTKAYACRMSDVREWVTTSGTTGNPLRIPLTQSDLIRLAVNEAVALNLAGVGPGDTVLIAVAMDRMFVAGLAYWLGAQRLGANCVRAGPFYAASLQALQMLAHDYSRPFLVTVPSLLLGAVNSSGGKTPHLAAIMNIAEPVRQNDLAPNALANRLAGHFHTPVLSTYACTETCATFAEGPQCHGGHLNPHVAIVEILNASGHPVEQGQIGEVVVTPLGVQGMPLIRFRTGDMAALHTSPCPCGRTTPRLGPVVGRLQQLLKVRGTSIYPTAISQWLQGLPAVEDFLITAEQEFDLSDRVTLYLSLHQSTDKLRLHIKLQAGTVLRTTPKIIFCNLSKIRSLQMRGNPRKPSRFLDLRPTHQIF